jgi:hypothetical protein
VSWRASACGVAPILRSDSASETLGRETGDCWDGWGVGEGQGVGPGVGGGDGGWVVGGGDGGGIGDEQADTRMKGKSRAKVEKGRIPWIAKILFADARVDFAIDSGTPSRGASRVAGLTLPTFWRRPRGSVNGTFRTAGALRLL